MSKQKQRTYARNRVKSSALFSRKGYERLYENDAAFFMKLTLCVVLGALWVRLQQPIDLGPLVVQAMPLGLVLGLLLVVRLEKYQFNRKLWYVTLILMAILTSFTPVGVMI